MQEHTSLRQSPFCLQGGYSNLYQLYSCDPVLTHFSHILNNVTSLQHHQFKVQTSNIMHHTHTHSQSHSYTHTHALTLLEAELHQTWDPGSGPGRDANIKPIVPGHQ